MSKINQPLTIKSVTFKNRIGMSPMCQYSANEGVANDWHLVHYGSRAVGGAGLIILEASAVSPEGRITPYDLGIWSDEQIPQLQKITSFIHSNGSVAGIQIAHAGRKASHDKPTNGGKQLPPTQGGWQTFGPSPIPFDPEELSPKELDKNGIEHIKMRFQAAALRAKKAGFRLLEIHAAHGYLIHEFLSPLSNTRNDEYGGSFENRIRLLTEIVDAVKNEWTNELPLIVRLSATDWTEGGWNPEETVNLSEILRQKGVDLIDCSTGGNIYNAKIKLAPGYQVEFSEAIRKTGIKTATVGLIKSAEQINNILENDQADIVLLGRELLRNPYFTLNVDDNIAWPEQYLRGK